MNDLMIEARGIRKQFGDLEVLKNIDLDIRSQEITSIVGASGAGKTTLLDVIAGRKSGGEMRGTIKLIGLKGRNLSAFRNSNIGFIFQFHRLLQEFSALENVLMPAWVAGKTTR